MAPTEFDIAIIGAGPVGTVLANFLGGLGMRTLLLDRESSAYHLPRAVAFDDEAMRIFQSLGLSDEIQAIAQPGLGALFVDGDGKTLVHWERPLQTTENGWFLNYRFHQPTLERVLRDALGRYPSVSLRWRTEVTELVEDQTGVTLTLRTPDGPDHVRAAYVVGCDGGRSFTRAAIGTRNEDLGFHEDWLIADFLLPEPEAAPDRNTYHYCGTARMGSKVFVGDQRKRWEFRLNPDDDRDKIGTPEQVWPLVQDWITPKDAKLERTTVYRFHSTIAESWRKGRVLLAGDAAHQTPPFMAQGMCAGLRDVANLAWKLASVLAGQDAQWLETYQSERAPHVREYITMTIALGNLINQTRDRIAGATVSETKAGNQRMSQIRPVIGPGLSAGVTTMRGQLFPQFELDAGGNLDDLVGYAPCLVTVPADIPDTVRRDFARAGITVLSQTSAALNVWLSTKQIAALLVRPDRCILGHVTDMGDLRDLLCENWRIDAG